MGWAHLPGKEKTSPAPVPALLGIGADDAFGDVALRALLLHGEPADVSVGFVLGHVQTGDQQPLGPVDKLQLLDGLLDGVELLLMGSHAFPHGAKSAEWNISDISLRTTMYMAGLAAGKDITSGR